MTQPQITSPSERSPSAAYLALMKFAEDHKGATRLLRVATQDYAAARCLLHNLITTGLVLGAQAMEKYLKAYVLLCDPTRNVRKLKHSLPALLGEVDVLAQNLALSRFVPLVERFKRYYDARYPDNGGFTPMTTAEIVELDEFILVLNENMPCPMNVKYRTGLYAAITFSLGYGATVTPTERWIKNNNVALIPLLPRIAQDYAAVITALHSD